MKVNNKLNRLALIVSLALSACAGQPLSETTPALDKEFGSSLKAAKDAQKIPTDANQAAKQSDPSAKELKEPFDNYIKGKNSTTPALDAPISSGNGQ